MIATLHPKQLIIVNIDLNNLGKGERANSRLAIHIG